MAKRAKPRVRIDVLGGKGAKRIIDEALQVLDRKGIEVHDAETAERLAGAGARVGDDRRVRIPPDLVERAVGTVPRRFPLFDRKGRKAFVVGDGIPRFDPGSAAIHILDRGRIRRPVTADLVRFVRLTDALDAIDAQSTGLVGADVPTEISDRYRLYVGLLSSSKPIVTGTFGEDGFAPMAEMLAAVRGSAEALRAKPLAIFDVCPSPPLKWSRLGCRSLLDCARSGIPAELISMPLAGATGPASLAGSLVQHAAESLSGIAIHQLAQPGAPIIFGGSPANFDIRAGTTPMGSPETLLLDLGLIRVGRALGIPVQSYIGMSDAKCLDAQCGFESAMGTLAAVLAGTDLAAGAGMLDFESCQSLEKLVIDAELCDGARILARGIPLDDGPLAPELLGDIAGVDAFLISKATLRRTEEEARRPAPIADRLRRERWAALGSRTIDERARERVEEILRAHEPAPVPGDLGRALRAIIEREARAHGLDRLPEGAP
ncbi:MAG: trimethylamine methyltransferase family protein [Planctomycetes bacterium]|nr:trimethylamine methyltransferase family protein [Planctomycetota bacterium]